MRLVRLVLLVSLAGRVAALAQAPPLGNELQVNTYTTLDQLAPAVDAAPDGRFVVAWESLEQDGSVRGIFGQRFDSTGSKDGSEFPVNTYTTGLQAGSSVAVAADGSFVVVWYTPYRGISGQRYGPTGAPVGGEFAVNTGTIKAANPSVDAAPDGSFVVAWEQVDGTTESIDAQRFDAAGAKVGSEFQVNTSTGVPGSPRVAVHASGKFVVAWTGSDLRAQRFDAAGIKVGAEFPLPTSDGHGPSLGFDAAGNLTAVWQEPDATHDRIAAQRYDASGLPVGTPFSVDSDATVDHSSASIAVAPDGGFVVAFQSNGPGAGREISARRFRFGGAPIGTDFAVSTHTSDYPSFPAVAAGARGEFVVAWSAQGDGAETGVFRRRNNLVAQPLAVDAHATGATDSDVDGVIEPGESALVEPSWKNVSNVALDRTGTASSFTGPPGAAYTIGNATADYGSIPSGTAQNCYDATAAHDCYRLHVGNPASRPAAHWDATFREDISPNGTQFWTLHVGDSFADVPRSQPFYRKIETLFHAGMTTGCGTATYCPDDAVNRGQMAIFIAKALARLPEYVPATGRFNAVDYNCSAAGTSAFTDVAPTDLFCKHVHYLALQNVTLGCGGTQYCPQATVTRDAMASFIAKAIVAPAGGNGIPETYTDAGTGLHYSCNPGSPSIHFTDVPASNPFCRHIHYLWAKGVVSGCGTTTYCPTQAVHRDAMAKFLANAFGLELYGS